MKVPQNRSALLTLVSAVMLLVAVYAAFRIPSTEGFNPTDDGVVLAQSYRVVHGEVPHKDFISIRPAGSAFMHAIHFISPLPLELSARWLTLLEYLLSASLLTSILVGSWFKGLRRDMFILVNAGSVVVISILSQNHYNLFPWTTIDSLFWFSLALYGWYRLKNRPGTCHAAWKVLILLSLSCSALCRQTFVLPGLLLFIRMIIWELKASDNRRVTIRRLVPALLLGFLPGWLYAGMLTLTGAWPDFIQQMTGRTELWQTGVAKFTESFWHSPVPFLAVPAIFTGLLKKWTAEAGRETYGIDLFIMVLKTVSFLAKMILVFAVFLKPDWLFAISFTFFWLLILDVFLVYIHEGGIPKWISPVFWILLAAWTSAVSLGDNAPVFALGWLTGAALLLQVRDFWNRIYRNVRPWQLIITGLLIPGLLVLSIQVQRKVNYRDLPANQLTASGGAIFPGLKGISLSPEIAAYLTEIKNIYADTGSPKGKFVVWPNNPLIYTLLGSRNPAPLDWMQPAEYVGSEKRLDESVHKLLRTAGTVVLVEKFNVKWFASAKTALVRPDYPYLGMLDTLAARVEAGSVYFDVYRVK